MISRTECGAARSNSELKKSGRTVWELKTSSNFKCFMTKMKSFFVIGVAALAIFRMRC